MPNFVSENSDEANLKSNVNHPEQVESPKHIIDNEERKSLHEQLQENKERKQLEYQQQLESQNSSYKLDEESAKFYNELNRVERERELNKRQQERHEVEKFRKLREERISNKIKKSAFSSNRTRNKILKKVSPTSRFVNSEVKYKKKLKEPIEHLQKTESNDHSIDILRNAPSSSLLDQYSSSGEE